MPQQWLRKHRADKAFRKVRSFSKLWFRWTVDCFESPTFLSRVVLLIQEKAKEYIKRIRLKIGKEKVIHPAAIIIIENKKGEILLPDLENIV